MNQKSNFVQKDHYTETLKVYLKLSGQREADIACLRSHIPRALEQLQLPKNKSRFNILSVGAGDGKMDHEILKTVQKGYLNTDKQLQEAKILNTAVEPHSMMIEEYKEFISKRPKEERAVVEFDLKPMTFEEYAKTEHEPNQYDMVQAIHSLSYVENLETTLKHCFYNELGEKGLIACLKIDSDFIMVPISEIKSQGKKMDDGKLIHRPRTSAEIVDVAEKNKWKFERVYCPFAIDVTGILRHNSVEGNLLLDFFTFTPAFRQSTDQEMVVSVLELLEKRSMEDEDGRLVVKAATELILIYK